MQNEKICEHNLNRNETCTTQYCTHTAHIIIKGTANIILNKWVVCSQNVKFTRFLKLKNKHRVHM